MATRSNIKALLETAIKNLRNTSGSPRLDAELLLAHCLKKDRSYLLAWPEIIPAVSVQASFLKLLDKRQQGIPVAYLLGIKEFWSLNLIVTPDVLIPRPETELLVETALEKIQGLSSPNILDLGTGSGAIALALAHERPDASITATDISQKSLQIAKKNARKHDIKNITFLQSDWFSNIPLQTFDLIVSNPPYIATNDPHLKNTDIIHEPQQALISGEEGLEDIKNIVTTARNWLNKKGWLIIEHGYDQGKNVPSFFKDYQQITTYKDINLLERVTLGQKHTPA
jgi:release factor glutamine methyltransferase